MGAITPDPPAPPPSADDNALAVWAALIADPWTAGQCLYHLHESFMHYNISASRAERANAWFYVYYPVNLGD